MKILRTPDECFMNLPGYPFAPHYTDVSGCEREVLRMHYVDEGPREAGAVLLLHGEPTWSFLYRKMIPIIVKAGHRAIAPDLIGFGKSDKPASRRDYSYQRHVDWMLSFIDQLDLQRMTLVCQDWGGSIGLRLVAAKPHLFDRVVAANTGMVTGDEPLSDAFMAWRKYAMEVPRFDVGAIIKHSNIKFSKHNSLPILPDEAVAAYDAPFPDETYKEGARIFPLLVPTHPDDPASEANRRAWQILADYTKPFLTAFSDGDPVTRGGDCILQKRILGARGQSHQTITGAGHFLQEDKGEEFATLVVNFIKKTSEDAL